MQGQREKKLRRQEYPPLFLLQFGSSGTKIESTSPSDVGPLFEELLEQIFAIHVSGEGARGTDGLAGRHPGSLIDKVDVGL